MAIQLGNKHLLNTQQIEVAVHGPDGATHLILCTGVADLGWTQKETYTFLVGPQLSLRQFVNVIASGALSGTPVFAQTSSKAGDQAGAENETNLILIHAGFDEASSKVRVSAEVYASIPIRLSISYHVGILAELLLF